MNNDDLEKWNESIEKTRQARIEALNRGMRSRGIKRRVNLFFARVFGRIAAWGERLRNEDMRDD